MGEVEEVGPAIALPVVEEGALAVDAWARLVLEAARPMPWEVEGSEEEGAPRRERESLVAWPK